MEFSPKEMARLNNNSLYQTLGIVVEEAKDGKARSKLRPTPAFCWTSSTRSKLEEVSSPARPGLLIRLLGLFMSRRTYSTQKASSLPRDKEPSR